MKESLVQTLTKITHCIMNEVEHGWQLDYDIRFRTMLIIINKYKLEFGKYLIDTARQKKDIERVHALQNINQLFACIKMYIDYIKKSEVSFKSEDIGTTDEEREKLWDTVREVAREEMSKYLWQKRLNKIKRFFRRIRYYIIPPH